MAATPEEFILKHATQPYDAAKRREYYLRTRELKGKMGTGKPFPTKTLKTAVQKTAKQVSTSNREEVQNKRKQVKARVDALNAKLDRLREILKGLESGRDKRKYEKKDTGKEADRKEPTAAEKKEAAKEAKERRDKEAKQSPNQALKEVRDKIADLQEQIKEARRKLQEAGANKASSEKPKA